MSDYPDFTITALLKGLYAGDPKALAVDVDGNMIAMLKALYGIVPTTLQCDVDGNMQMNLVAQELSEIINRLKYGAPDLDIIYKEMLAGTDEIVYSLAGKGQIYTAYIHAVSTASQKDDIVNLSLDGEIITFMSYENLQKYNMYDHTFYSMALIEYNEVNYTYTVIMCVGYTFEEGISIKYNNNTAVPMTVYGEVIYSVI